MTKTTKTTKTLARIPAIIPAAVLAAMVALPLAAPADAAEPTPMIYHDMGGVQVQHKHEACGYQTLSVAYQLELKDPSVEARIEQLDPKIRATLFRALDDHLAEGGATSLGVLRRVMLNAVEEVLGKDVVTDVLIIQSHLVS
jgi:flagellar basal body-associated protein FliL